MTDITKLAAELRRIAEEICKERHAGWPNGLNDIADQLEDTLPTWTKVTDRRDLPEDGEYMWAWSRSTADWRRAICDPSFIEHLVSSGITIYYRELGPIDRPGV